MRTIKLILCSRETLGDHRHAARDLLRPNRRIGPQAGSQSAPATTGGETPASIAPGIAAYSTSLKISNMGRYIEITMAPTMPPTTTIIIGSRIEVKAFTAASTSDS